MAAVSADGRPVWVLIRLVPRSRYHVETSRLAARGLRSAERRAWLAGVYAIIAAMTSPQPQGELTVERMCMLAGVNRAGYYRHVRSLAPVSLPHYRWEDRKAIRGLGRCRRAG
jgi:hypothetical protein